MHILIEIVACPKMEKHESSIPQSYIPKSHNYILALICVAHYDFGFKTILIQIQREKMGYLCTIFEYKLDEILI